MAADDKPRLEDPGIIAQRMMGARTGGGDDKSQFETIVDGMISRLTRLLGRFGLRIRLRTLGSTSMFAQFTPTQAFGDKSINEGASSGNVKGGVIADIAKKAGFTKPDFSSIAKPAIEGYPVTSMSYAALGNLVPNDTGGGGRGGHSLG